MLHYEHQGKLKKGIERETESLNKTIDTSAVCAEVKRNRVNMCWKTDAEPAEIISAFELLPNLCPVLHRGLTTPTGNLPVTARRRAPTANLQVAFGRPRASVQPIQHVMSPRLCHLVQPGTRPEVFYFDRRPPRQFPLCLVKPTPATQREKKRVSGLVSKSGWVGG